MSTCWRHDRIRPIVCNNGTWTTKIIRGLDEAIIEM